MSCWHAWIWFWLSEAWALLWACLCCRPGLEYLWEKWIPFSHRIAQCDPESISFGDVDYWLIYFTMISTNSVWICQRWWPIWDLTLFKSQWVIFIDAGGRQRLLGQQQWTLVLIDSCSYSFLLSSKATGQCRGRSRQLLHSCLSLSLGAELGEKIQSHELWGAIKSFQTLLPWRLLTNKSTCSITERLYPYRLRLFALQVSLIR